MNALVKNEYLKEISNDKKEKYHEKFLFRIINHRVRGLLNFLN